MRNKSSPFSATLSPVFEHNSSWVFYTCPYVSFHEHSNVFFCLNVGKAVLYTLSYNLFPAPRCILYFAYLQNVRVIFLKPTSEPSFVCMEPRPSELWRASLKALPTVMPSTSASVLFLLLPYCASIFASSAFFCFVEHIKSFPNLVVLFVFLLSRLLSP